MENEQTVLVAYESLAKRIMSKLPFCQDASIGRTAEIHPLSLIRSSCWPHQLRTSAQSICYLLISRSLLPHSATPPQLELASASLSTSQTSSTHPFVPYLHDKVLKVLIHLHLQVLVESTKCLFLISCRRGTEQDGAFLKTVAQGVADNVCDVIHLVRFGEMLVCEDDGPVMCVGELLAVEELGFVWVGSRSVKKRNEDVARTYR